MSHTTDKVIELEQAKFAELKDLYDTHDCTRTPEDGCEVCEEYFKAVHGEYYDGLTEDEQDNQQLDAYLASGE